MKIVKNLNEKRDRIQDCIKKYGWISDHNLDWFLTSAESKDGELSFVEFDDGSGVLAHVYSAEWHIWSDPLCKKEQAASKIAEFVALAFKSGAKKIKCLDVSESISPQLEKSPELKLSSIEYSLYC